MSRAFIASPVIVLLVACGGSTVPVGRTDASDLQLQTKKDGTPTGDGSTCSWAGTSTYDAVSPTAPGAPVPTYQRGDEFKSIDGCNDCACSDKGIMCTMRACESPPGGGTGPGGSGPGVGCTEEAKSCPDGTTVWRQGPTCDFIPCKDEGPACTRDAKKCPDGSYVGRTGPGCTFTCPGDEPIACPAIARVCPDGSPAKTGPKCEQICPNDPAIACSADAKKCPDGSFVGRTGPNCEFVCPE